MSHAALPVTIALFLALASQRWLPGRGVTVWTAFAVNAAITLPSFTPTVHRVLTPLGAVIALACLWSCATQETADADGLLPFSSGHY